MKFRRAALVTALLVPAIASAQRRFFDEPYAPIVLLLPSGPRTLAMGNTGIGSRDDEVIFFNPAQIVIARGFAVSGERYSATSAGGSLSSVTRFNTGGIAFGMRMVDYEVPTNRFPTNRERMLNEGPAAGTSYEASVGIGQLVKGVRVGGVVKYVEDAVPATRVGRAVFDIGVSKDLFRFYTFGLAVQNMGKSMTIPCNPFECIPAGTPSPNATTTAILPFRATLGAAMYRAVGGFDVVATAAIAAIRYDGALGSGGAEVGYSWLDGYSVALRAGLRTPLPGEKPITGGFGYNMDRLSIDYAIETLVGWRTGHRVGLRIR